jgi:hypothetical protein
MVLMAMFDIDIDLADRTKLLDMIKHVPARNGDRRHNTGVYAHRVPVDPSNGFCTIDYKTAENRFFKIDFLNVNIYNSVKSEQHLLELINREPMWELLEHREFVEQLFHIGNHYNTVKQHAPKSIEQLAAVLAIIRPAKKHLIGESWTNIFEQVWTAPTNGEYYFKKSHAFSYAMVVIVHMNLLVEQLYLSD